MSAAYHHVERVKLKNGVQLLHVRTALPLAWISAYFPFGSRHDPVGQEGMAHLMEHLVMKTTPEVPTSSAMRALHAARGLSYNASTSGEVVQFRFMTLVEDAVEATRFFAESLATYQISVEQLDTERRIIADEWARKQQEPLRMLYEWTRASLFQGTRLMHSGLGTAESLNTVSVDDVVRFSEDFVRNAEKTTVICSPLSADAFVEALEHLPPVTSRRAGKNSADTLAAPRPLYIERGPAKNIRAAVAYRLPVLTDERDEAAVRLLFTAYLGGNGASRLINRLREELQLTYGLSAMVVPQTDGVSAAIRFSVDKTRLSEALAACDEEIRRVCAGDIDQALLASSKKEMRYRLMQACTDIESVAEWYGTREMLGLPMVTFDERCAAIEAVTAEDLVRVAKDWCTVDRRSVVLYGDVPEEMLKA